MTEATYIIFGDPVPLARIRFGNRRAYDAQRRQKRDAMMQLISQQPDSLFSGPLKVDFIFYMPIPSSHSLKRKNVMPYSYHHKKPDLSNLIKFAEDVSNNILFLDDSLISEINAMKVYVPVDQTRTEIKIRSVKVYDSKEKFKKE